MIPEVRLKKLAYDNVKKFQTFVETKRSLKQAVNLSLLIHKDVQFLITSLLKAIGEPDADQWLSYDHEKLFEWLISLSGGENNVTSLQEKIDNAKMKLEIAIKAFQYHPLKPASTNAFIQGLIEIIRVCEVKSMSDSENKALVDTLLKQLADGTDGKYKEAIESIRNEMTGFKARIPTLDLFLTEFIRITTRITKVCQDLVKYKLGCTQCNSAKEAGQKRKVEYTAEEKAAYKKKKEKELEEKKLTATQALKTSKSEESSGKPLCNTCGKNHNGVCYKLKDKKKGLKGERHMLASTNHIDSIPETIACQLTYNMKTVDVRALVDTGALNANYISEDIANEFWKLGVKPIDSCVKICSAFSGQCTNAHKKLALFLTITNEVEEKFETIPLEFTVINTTYDVIIGRPTIVAHDLVNKLQSQFKIAPKHLPTHMLVPPATTRLDQPQPRSTRDRLQTLATMRKVENMSVYIDRVEDADGIPFKDEETPWQRVADDTEPEDGLPKKVYGTPENIQATIKLMQEFHDIFSTELRPEPANVPPMEIPVDVEKWEAARANRLPARPQSILKQKETVRQIDIMKRNRVIRDSKANRYSQILLAPKPNNKWRFCVAFDDLNKCSTSMGWPIPNIEAMLRRIGSQRAKYYGIMDLTSGYHQAPLSASARIFTAFITFCGVYEWLRVPMGLKGAPSYFQKIMASVVLAGLLYFICELYLDDILIYARSHEEFLERLRKVFERLRKHKLTVNPTKCSFGMSEVEYVGHVINEKGLSFSHEKKEKVFNIPKPTIGKHLKSFIGCAEYFHSHIKNFSDKIRPLHKMLADYEKTRNKKLVWEPAAEAAFEQIREEIRNCPTLFFLHPDAPITLQTDASDYGIGAYLFQTIDGIDYPVAFMSRALTDAESRWSTIEKECYAIIFALKKFEHLLRDVKFTLQTDHKNLTYVNESLSPKVRRWKLLIQEFDFDIEYLKGEDNIVADAFSRLLTVDNDSETLCLLDEFKIPSDKYKIIGKIHNSQIGHHGVETSMKKLLATNPTTGKPCVEPWPQMREHVRRFIKTCPCCQKMSQIKVQIKTQNYTTAAYEPMERLNVDTIGPLPEDAEGNKYIIVIIDCFTRWVELYATKSTSSEDAAKALLQHTGRYGQASQILSDNGSQFVNETITELLKLLGSEHVRTIAYSHEQNAIVERANKEVMRHLRALVYDDKTFANWGLKLPIVQRIMNCTEHESIGVSPSQLLLGNAFSIDREMYLPITALNLSERQLSKWADESLLQQQRLLTKAKENQMSIDAKNISKRSKEAKKYKLTEDELEIGSYVIAAYPDSGMGNRPPNKLMLQNRGPFQILSKKRGGCMVRNLATNKEIFIKTQLLKPWHHDPEFQDPAESALHDKNLFVIEKIVKHRGNPKQISSLEFWIKWEGYESSENTWEPWKNVRETSQVHDYLKRAHLNHLIPKQFR